MTVFRVAAPSAGSSAHSSLIPFPSGPSTTRRSAIRPARRCSTGFGARAFTARCRLRRNVVSVCSCACSSTRASISPATDSSTVCSASATDSACALLNAPARNMAIVAGRRCNSRAIPINPDAAGPDTVNAHATSSLSQHLSNLPAAASASACARVASASCSTAWKNDSCLPTAARYSTHAASDSCPGSTAASSRASSAPGGCVSPSLIGSIMDRGSDNTGAVSPENVGRSSKIRARARPGPQPERNATRKRDPTGGISPSSPPRFTRPSRAKRDPNARPDRKINPSSPRVSPATAERNATRTTDADHVVSIESPAPCTGFPAKACQHGHGVSRTWRRCTARRSARRSRYGRRCA